MSSITTGGGGNVPNPPDGSQGNGTPTGSVHEGKAIADKAGNKEAAIQQKQSDDNKTSNKKQTKAKLKKRITNQQDSSIKKSTTDQETRQKIGAKNKAKEAFKELESSSPKLESYNAGVAFSNQRGGKLPGMGVTTGVFGHEGAPTLALVALPSNSSIESLANKMGVDKTKFSSSNDSNNDFLIHKEDTAPSAGATHWSGGSNARAAMTRNTLELVNSAIFSKEVNNKLFTSMSFAYQDAIETVRQQKTDAAKKQETAKVVQASLDLTGQALSFGTSALFTAGSVLKSSSSPLIDSEHPDNISKYGKQAINEHNELNPDDLIDLNDEEEIERMGKENINEKNQETMSKNKQRKSEAFNTGLRVGNMTGDLVNHIFSDIGKITGAVLEAQGQIESIQADTIDKRANVLMQTIQALQQQQSRDDATIDDALQKLLQAITNMYGSITK